MSIEEQLLSIEHLLAAGSSEEYQEHLDNEAIVIVPGQVLDKRETVAAMGQSPGWADFRITDPRVLPLNGDAAILTYRFDGYREEELAYGAAMSSLYRGTGEGWKLVLHQQTPIAAA